VDPLTTLGNIVKEVKSYLAQRHINVPFFIAGGSVFSIMNGNINYSDIDVFLYNIDDYETIANAVRLNAVIETKNAITVHNKDGALPFSATRTIQFIRLHVGSIEEVFDTFDFNCCRRAITSDNKLYVDDDSKFIKVYTKNINASVYSRYLKYVNNKKAEDRNNATIKVIMRHLIDHYSEIYDYGYDDEYKATALDLLVQIIRNPQFSKHAQFVHDSVVEKDIPTRLEIFSKLTTFSNFRIENRCDECRLFELISQLDSDVVFKVKNRYFDEDDNRVKLKYAEYFV
jgi:hypothetical protein